MKCEIPRTLCGSSNNDRSVPVMLLRFLSPTWTKNELGKHFEKRNHATKVSEAEKCNFIR